jgi:hypothetical protein
MKNSYFQILLMLATLPAFCQESTYFANGSRFNFRLLDANNSTVQIGEQKNGQTVKRTLPRENVILTFNTKGNYLLISDLDFDAARAASQLAEFYNGSGVKSDIIITSNPVQVIPCTISYKSEELVNYTNSQNVAASLNQKDIVLIVMKDGQHEFSLPPAEAVSKLIAAKQNMQALFKAEQQPAAAVVSETPQVQPTIVTDRAEAETIVTRMAENHPANNRAPIPGLNDTDIAAYGKKGVQKVDEFVQYLNVISDKNIQPEKKDEAIDQALRLFLKGATIEVSSANRNGKRKYLIKDYLTRLKLLPYGSTQISWNEVNYIKDLTLADDGKYYGIISGSQTFTGYSATNPDEVIYSDITQKTVKVQLQSYEKSVEGQQLLNWEILLGNVGVSVK